jgi:hypothetical protein
MKYKKGTRMKCTQNTMKFLNQSGKIIGYRSGYGVLFQFDNFIHGHTGNNVTDLRGKSGHCWWFTTDTFDRFFTIDKKEIIEEILK